MGSIQDDARNVILSERSRGVLPMSEGTAANTTMNIVFLGTSDYGEPALRALVRECYPVAAVVTQPDRKCGRGLKAAPCAIKSVAGELGLNIFQPENINAPDSVARLKSLACGLLVVISYGQILSEEVLSIPSIMPINIHGSLLPRYRGSAPVNAALLNGDTVTGNSLMKIRRKMDSGPVILQKERPVLDEDDAVSLEKKLSLDAAELLLDGLRLIASGSYPLEEQEEGRVSFARKLKKEHGLIDWGKGCSEIRNQIRGLAGWPGTFSFYQGKTIKIFPPARCLETSTGSRPGIITAISHEAITVACGRGALEIRELQPEARRRMPAAEFCAGHRLKEGDRFGDAH